MGKFLSENTGVQNDKMIMTSLKRVEPKTPRTAQAILSDIMKKWCDDLDTMILPAETKTRMSNLLMSEHRNYKFFRSEFLTLIDFALRKGVIK